MLSPAQLTTLKAAINAETDATIVAARAAGDTPTIAKWYNQQHAPATKAWLSAADRRTIDEAADYASFDGIVAGKRDAWRLFLDGAPRHFGKPRNRQAVTDVWGASNSSSTVAFAILSACTRNITRAEAVLGGSNTESIGSSTGQVPAIDLTWEGPLSAADVVDALAS